MAEHPFDTFRLRGFPSDMTLSSFTSFLRQNELEPVGNASLAPDAACSGSARTATLTLKREQGRKPQVPDSWDQVRLKVDEIMEAFTPLNDVGNTQDYVDIVGITGLAGRAFGSWQCKTGEMWLRDFIPRDIRHTRTHIYGYQSALQKNTSAAGLLYYTETFVELLKTYLKDEPTRRPLILVGHSLGCLIIKQMLVEYAGRPEHNEILDRIYSIVLIGPPHRGLNTKSLETLVEGSRREPLIKDLKFNSTLLELLRKKFAEVSKAIKVVTCYELKKTPTSVPKHGKPGEWERIGPLEMMVEPDSACLYTTNELRIGIDKNHSEIGKLEDDWPAYQDLKEALAHHVRAAPRAISERFSHRGAIRSLRQICEIGQSLMLVLLAIESQWQPQTATGSITPMELLSIALEFFSQFRKFLEDEVSIAILQRESLPIPFAQRISESIAEVEADFTRYMKFTTKSKAVLWSQPGDATSESNRKSLRAPHFDLTDPMLKSERIIILSEKASHCAVQVRTETIFAMLGLQEEPTSERISQSTAARTIGLAKAEVRQTITRRASEIIQDTSTFTPLSGFLDDQSSTPSLNLGSYFSKAGADGIDVIIERRPYGQKPGAALVGSATKRTLEEQEQRDKKQLARLSSVLEKMTEIPDEGILQLPTSGSEPCVMRCLGYMDKPEPKQPQIEILFEVPSLRSGSSARDIINLHSALTNKSVLRNLDQRFRLARSLCLAVLNLHSWGWLHKDITSQNVLLVPVSNSSEPFVAYLRGFEYARHSTDSTTLTAINELEMNLYRHPDRQGKPTIEFTKKHDLYAVGVVLYEIATLKTVKSSLDSWLGKFFNHNKHPEGEDIAKELRRRAATDLPMVMGSKYADAVRRCLESDFHVLHDDKMQIELSVSFRDLVLGPIDTGCHL